MILIAPIFPIIPITPIILIAPMILMIPIEDYPRLTTVMPAPPKRTSSSA